VLTAAHAHAHHRTRTGLEKKTLVRPSWHEAYFLALLVAGKAVQYFNLGTVTKLRFVNELMQQDLRHLLTILLQVRHPPLRSLSLSPLVLALTSDCVRVAFVVSCDVCVRATGEEKGSKVGDGLHARRGREAQHPGVVHRGGARVEDHLPPPLQQQEYAALFRFTNRLLALVLHSNTRMSDMTTHND
jgi:hypothetical protein